MMTSASLAIYNEPSFTSPDFPALDNILVQDNYFESDGYYALYCGALSAKTGAFAKNMTVTGNVFGRGLHRLCGVGGPAICFDPSQPGNVWSNNTWGAKGPTTLDTDPLEGAIIDAPNVQ
jgi:hypothetical protein